MCFLVFIMLPYKEIVEKHDRPMISQTRLPITKIEYNGDIYIYEGSKEIKLTDDYIQVDYSNDQAILIEDERIYKSMNHPDELYILTSRFDNELYFVKFIKENPSKE